jgi:hypothetical protein
MGFGLDFSLFARRYWGNPGFGFFSSSYLDASVRRVPAPFGAPQFPRVPRWEVPFGYPRILDCVRLPEAFRSLPRPSSALKPDRPPNGVACRAYLVIGV